MEKFKAVCLVVLLTCFVGLLGCNGNQKSENSEFDYTSIIMTKQSNPWGKNAEHPDEEVMARRLNEIRALAEDLEKKYGRPIPCKVQTLLDSYEWKKGGKLNGTGELTIDGKTYKRSEFVCTGKMIEGEKTYTPIMVSSQ